MHRDDEGTKHSGMSLVPVEGGLMLTYWRTP